MVIIGNWLHTDGLMARLKNTGIFKVLEFPLLRDGPGTETERCTWRAKYPTQEAIDRKRDELGEIEGGMAVMLDVESWGGQIRGDRSAGINAAYDAVGAFVGSTEKVIGYGNVGDLNSL